MKPLSFLINLVSVFILVTNFACAEVIINEVMYDLNGSDTNREWIEIYNNGSEAADFSYWKFYEANTKHGLNLINGSVILAPGGYAIICQVASIFLNENNVYTNLFESSFSLDNSGEALALWNGSSYVGNFTYNSSFGATGDGKSLQLYNGSWQGCQPTPGATNNCSVANSQTQNTSNSSDTNSNLVSTTSQTTIELSWYEDEIINGSEFDITVKAFNMANDYYDIKIWIEFYGNDTVISERYDTINDQWKSGTYYVEKLLSGGGNKTETLSLRLKEDYLSFYGDMKILSKLRKYSSSSVLADTQKSIKILKSNKTSPAPTNQNSTLLTSSMDLTNNSQKAAVIRLGSSDKTLVVKSKTEDSIIYKSKNEYIKEYLPYGFGVLCIILIILLFIERGKNK
jgi:hypothetical protein